MHRSLPNNKIIDLAIRVQINLVKLAQSASHVYKHLYLDKASTLELLMTIGSICSGC